MAEFETGLTHQEKYEEPQDFSTVLWSRFNDLKHEIHCQKACKVEFVDNTGNYVNLKILDKDSDGQGNIIDYPIIPNVPIRQSLESGKAYIRLPVQIGDIGTIEFFDSSVDDVIKQSAYGYSYEEEWHSLSDGIFTNGFLPENKLIAIDSTRPISIGTKDGIFKFYVDALGKFNIEDLNDIKIKSGTLITLDAPEVETTGNLSAGTGYSGSFACGSLTLTFSNGILTNVG